MIKKIYRILHDMTSAPHQRGEYSSGYWSDRVRDRAAWLCKPSGGRILEVGCGEGMFLEKLAREKPDAEIWGIDKNEAILELAKKRMSAGAIKNVKLLAADATSLPFEEEFFDAVVCIDVLLNMEDIGAVVRILGQMKRVCKRSGVMIFDFRNAANPLLILKYKLAPYYDDTVKDLPLNAYKLGEIESALRGLGLEIVQKEYVGFFIKRYAPVIIVKVNR